MSLKEFFTGTLQEKNAADQVQKLQAKESLSKKDLARLDMAKKIVRGRMTRVVVTIGITLGGAGGYGVVKSRTESVSEQIADAIEKIEVGMSNLERLTAEGRQQLGDFAVQQLNSPFEVVKMNAQNRFKNDAEFLEAMEKQGNRNMYRVENPYHFRYHVDKKMQGMSAGFLPLHRVMSVSDDIDPNNLLDMLVVYHELSHALSDANTRQQLRSKEEFDAYMSFYTSGPNQQKRMILNEEATAYAREIEMLNILLKGKLKESVTTGKALSIDDIQKVLNCKSMQHGTIEMLITLANAYYPEGMSTGNFTKKFMDMIAAMYRSQGYEVYVPWSTRGFRKYE